MKATMIYFALLLLAVAVIANPMMGGANGGQPAERESKFFGYGGYGGWGYGGYGYGYPYYGGYYGYPYYWG